MEKKEIVDNILSDFQYAETIRSKFHDRWADTMRFISPSIYDWNNLDAIPHTPKRWSSVPIQYRGILINGLVGYSISPNITWFKLSLEDTEQLKLYGVKDWLEEAESVMLAEFNRSNLYREAPKLIGSGVDIGHGVMFVDEDLSSGRLRFTNIRANEIYLDLNPYGEAKVVYRKYLMTLKALVEHFGLDNLNDNLKDKWKDIKQRNDTVTVLHAVFKREEYNPDLPDVLNMEYAGYFIDLDNKHLMKETGYENFPYAVFLWEQIPGYPYSESPANQALPDIKYLNTINDTSMKIAQTSAEPPMKMSRDVLDIDITPRGVTQIDKDGILEPVRTGENYQVTLTVAETVKQAVRDWFSVDFFLMLQQKTGKMTATEVMELQGEKAAVLTNVIVSLNSTLQAIIQRCFNLLLKSGKIPMPPQSLMESPTQMKVDFVGPLSQAQKKYHELGGISEALSTAIPIMQAFPESGDYIDADQLMIKALQGNAMPQSVIREDKDVENIRKARQEQQQAMMEQQMQQQQADMLMSNYDKLSKKPENQSAIQQMNAQLQGVL